mgnify:FL=1
MEKVCFTLPDDFDFEDATNNLILNMTSGLLPKDLQKEEIALLERRFGANWFEALGYYEPEYEKPK